jgi:cob(I)alamin adenosyltransferase
LKIYTRTGDDGTTGLFYGGRIGKSAVGPSAYGTLDETVSALGLARAESADPELTALLVRLQRELFVVGAELATAPEQRAKLVDGQTRTTATMVEALEPIIDDIVSRSPMPTEFVLPGQNRVGAALDFARAVCRRAEREIVEAVRVEWLAPESNAIPYVNRLADLLWILARWQEGVSLPLHAQGSSPDDAV